MTLAVPPAGAPHLGEVVLRPVRGHHAFESCVEQLATAIRLGVYPTGSVLPPERDLAERMAVSRATVREAIAALRQAGMVRTTRGRGGGSVVCFDPPAPAHEQGTGLSARRDQLLDCLVFRGVVEPGACATAAGRHLTSAEEAMLERSLKEVAEAPDPAAHRQADSRLHLAIAGLTRSPMIIAAVTDVQACLHDMLQAIPVLEVNIEHSNIQHTTIVAAIRGRSPARARGAMEQHCADTAALVRGLLD